MPVNFPKPKLETLVNFISLTHKWTGYDLSVNDVMETFNKKMYNPFAAGHFSTIDYSIKLASKSYFPVRVTYDFSTEEQSDKSLIWLRDIHQKMMTPLAKNGYMIPQLDKTPITTANCGNYRIDERFVLDGRNAMKRYFLKANYVRSMLYWWYKDLCEFHLKMTSKIDKATCSIPDLQLLADAAYKKHLQFQCIHPFYDGNGRVGRIIENILRLRWGLAWKTPKIEDKVKHVQDVVGYEDGDWQKLVKEFGKPI